MSTNDALTLRLYRGEDGPVAYAPDGRAWRTAIRDEKTVPLGIAEPWVLIDGGQF